MVNVPRWNQFSPMQGKHLHQHMY